MCECDEEVSERLVDTIYHGDDMVMTLVEGSCRVSPTDDRWMEGVDEASSAAGLGTIF